MGAVGGRGNGHAAPVGAHAAACPMHDWGLGHPRGLHARLQVQDVHHQVCDGGAKGMLMVASCLSLMRGSGRGGAYWFMLSCTPYLLILSHTSM
jgi:hypothetical protein